MLHRNKNTKGVYSFMKWKYDWFFTIGMLVATIGIGIYAYLNGNSVRVMDSGLLFITSVLTIIVFVQLRVIKFASVHFLAQFFIFLALFIGKFFDVYAYFPWWDTFLHAISGVMLGLAALLVLGMLVPRQFIRQLSPVFLVVFVCCFGIAMAGIWEIFEFAGDTLFGFQSQGNSLWDTMIDITMGTAGSLIVAPFAYIHQKNGNIRLMHDLLQMGNQTMGGRDAA